MGEKPTVDPGSEAEHQHAVLAAASLLPEMRMTATAVAAPTPQLAPAALPLAPTPGPERVLGNHDSDPGPSGGSREPRIIIRGGMGSPDDDCDLLHHRRGYGAAVNRIVPPLGGRSGGFGGSTRFR